MKILLRILLVIIAITPNLAYSQEISKIEYIATETRVRNLDEQSRKWKPWSDWVKSNAQVIFDINNDVVVVKDNFNRIYFIEEYKFVEESGMIYHKIKATDNEDTPSELTFSLKENGDDLQLLVRWMELEVSYKLIIK